MKSAELGGSYIVVVSLSHLLLLQLDLCLHFCVHYIILCERQSSFSLSNRLYE